MAGEQDFEFKSEYADKIADKVDAVADRIRAVLSRMSEEEAARWGCWGADKTGRKFAYGDDNNGYIPGSKNQHDVIGSYCGFLSGDEKGEGYAPEFRDAAKVLRVAEHANEIDILRAGRIGK